MEGLIRAIICLMDGRVIIVNEDGKVSLLTADGKLQKHLPFTDSAWTVTQTNQNTIALSFPGKGIEIYNTEKETVTKFIKLAKTCWGISFSNNYLAVGLNDDEIRIIDLEGNTKNTIQVQSESDLHNIVYHNDRLIYSDFIGAAVTCIDTSGKQIWQYKEDLTGPTGLCTDVYGNIIVADYVSSRIIVISNDGQNSKELIGKDDGLYSPKCICVKHNESSGYMCDGSRTNLAKFNLSYG
ncbi:TRIM2_3 [Mytilus edulis]|uniref:TRIM2_3 n=1 Tax=Mytilus edulis TaxID=6550 RepID=A0A8S3UP77_MYTED|nr:TRIM2_3 [Mytilus edulis]